MVEVRIHENEGRNFLVVGALKPVVKFRQALKEFWGVLQVDNTDSFDLFHI